MDLTRKQFLQLCAGAVGFAACNGSDSQAPAPAPDAPPVDAPIGNPPVDAPPMGACFQNGTLVQIGNNHSHTMDVPAADIAAGVQQVYQIQGTSQHPHTVTVTAQMFMKLQMNMPVMVASSLDDNHTHLVTLRCA